MFEASDYVKEYYNSYATGELDDEMKIVGSFLVKNVRGETLDCGCGPVPQLWAIFMPHMEELYAVDLPQESIDFVKEKLADPTRWTAQFSQYENLVEKLAGPLSKNYISGQLGKIKEVRQADMTITLPLPENFFDTAVSLYSLGCLKNEDELNAAIENINKVLKPRGKLLHVNTNGENSNTVLPAYTWNGLSQASSPIKNALKKAKFGNITTETIHLSSDTHGKYHYDSLSLLSAIKS